MSFYDLNVHETNLTISLSNFEVYIKTNYDKFYKENRLDHMLHGDKRFPNIKVTNDIFSTFLYFKTKADSEVYFIIDGKLDKIENILHFSMITSSIDYELNLTEYESYILKLKELSSICTGDILLHVNAEAYKISNGNMHDTNMLINDIYQSLDMENKATHKRVFEFLTKK